MVPGLRWLVGLLIASVVIAGLFFGRELLIPLALAVLLGFLLDPAVTRLKRWGLPRMVATLVVVVLALGALSGMGFYLGKQVQSLSASLPTYQNTIQEKLRNLRTLSSGPSAWDGAIKTYSTVEGEIAKADAKGSKGNDGVQKVEVVREQPKPLEMVGQWLGKVSEPVAMIGIVLLFVILILLDRDDLRDRLLRLMGGNLHVATDALDEASDRIGKYLRMQFIVNVTYGIPMALGLWWIGVPGAILWGVLATIMRFVPYVGPMISAIFPLALAFAVAPGWDMLLWTAGLIVVLELISNNVIEPWLYGSSTGLSTLAIIMAATFWTSLWGPIGLILSTPLTVCLLVLGRYLPGLRFMEVLLGSQPVLDAPHRFYQRLLADDVNGAIELAQDDIAERLPSKPTAEDTAQAVVDFYAEVGLPTLQLAYKHHTENATAEHRMRLSNGMEDVLEDVLEDYPAAIGAQGPRLRGAIHCVGGRWEVDALAADMVAHSLSLQGMPATCAGHALTPAVGADETLGWGDAQWLLLSVFSAQPQAMVRQIVRRVRRRYPQLPVIVALWNADETALQDAAVARMGVAAVVTSLPELLLRMAQLRSPDQAAHGYVAAQLPDGDAARVEYLQHSGALAAQHLPTYKDAVLKAANAFNVKYAQVSLVDHDWVHTPGSLLLRPSAPMDQPGLPRDISICSYVVRDGEDLVVEDVARDPRFADNPALNEAQVKFYAGVPLKSKKGEVLGTLCIMHDAPRTMQDGELEVLHDMAQDLMDTLRHVHKSEQASMSTPPSAVSEDDGVDA
jgi:predicted PurR-regulated permease PerM/GAF domain-containing protein